MKHHLTQKASVLALATAGVAPHGRIRGRSL